MRSNREHRDLHSFPTRRSSDLEDQQLWVDEGGAVDYAARTVTTPVNVEGFGVFTLGKIKEEDINPGDVVIYRSEEHTSELQSRPHLVCRLLLEKKKYNT